MKTIEPLIVCEASVPDFKEIWTIGHSTRSIAEFLALLHEHEIDSIVDVRSFPGSRRYPQFGRETMSAWLEADAITYQVLEITPTTPSMRRTS